jgi:hypothetical protein
MAALYWRYKKNGRWTWTRVKLYKGLSMQNVIDDLDYYSLIHPLEEEE